MTTSSAGRRRHRSAQAPAAPLPAGPAPTGPPPARTAPARTPPARAAAAGARSRTGPGRCCRTWSSERLLPGGAVSRTTWHEPACAARGRG
ncbi:hypothetical protein [Kitasatospora indigofera]|uniref:hypothetical protein n=1 Tax=Kitasatospora indigofera TaxID=67307 RepID=UPI00167C5376|nr:hypothetical protein [Kitasatospora indigofera]